MAELRLEVNPERITVDDAIALEEGTIKGMRDMRDFLARFVVSGDDEPVSTDDALVMVGGLTLAQLGEALDGVGLAYHTLQESAVDPTTNGG